MARRRGSRRFLNVSRETRRTLLWLVLCFPLGLMRMWKRSCRWPVAAKIAVTGVLALAVVLILLPATTPKPVGAGGVQLVGREPDVEIYGPELPEDVNLADYESILYTSATSVPVATPEPETYVYASVNDEFYHRETCRKVKGTAYKFTVYAAHFSGFEPCPLCDPPRYEGK